MPSASKGAIIECDPAIRALVITIDKKNRHGIIIEELDDNHLLIESSMVAYVRKELNQLLSENTYRPEPAEGQK